MDFLMCNLMMGGVIVGSFFPQANCQVMCIVAGLIYLCAIQLAKQEHEKLEKETHELGKFKCYYYTCIEQKKEIEELKKSNNRLNYIIQQQEKPNATELQYQEENKKDIIYYTFANED